MNKQIDFYGGLCPKDYKKLEFRTDKKKDIICILFAVCKKCNCVYMLDFKQDGIFVIEEIEIDYTKILDMEED